MCSSQMLRNVKMVGQCAEMLEDFYIAAERLEKLEIDAPLEFEMMFNDLYGAWVYWVKGVLPPGASMTEVFSADSQIGQCFELEVGTVRFIYTVHANEILVMEGCMDHFVSQTAVSVGT